MSSSANVLPPLQALLNQAPAGTNPYAWWAEQLYEESYPGLAPWSKPLFWILAVVSLLNIPLTIFTMVVKHRAEGGLSFYKLREHKSGGRYICLNATTVFLAGHLITCGVFLTFPMLHLYRYDQPGRAWQDLCWAAFMWLAPYLELLFTSTGILYAILVTPSPLAYARKLDAHGQLVAHQPPLAGLPVWLLNSFIFAAPVAVSVAVLIPGIRLILACKRMELFGIHVVFATVEAFAMDYAKGIVPAIADQAAFLESLAQAAAYRQESVSRWSPLYGIWLVFVALASVLSIVAFFAVRSVTKTRLRLAQQSYSEQTRDSAVVELDELRRWEKKQSESPRQVAAVKQARWEHNSLVTQFVFAAVLLIICDVMLFVDTIVGYEVHAKRNLLALCLLVPPYAYMVQSTTSLVLTLIRTMQGKTAAQAMAANAASTATRSAHTRTDSENSMADKKYYFGAAALRSGDAGTIFVSALPKQAYPVSPSVVHQIQIDQVVEHNADRMSVAEVDLSVAASTPNRSRSELLPDSEATTPRLDGVEKHFSEAFYGQAV